MNKFKREEDLLKYLDKVRGTIPFTWVETREDVPFEIPLNATNTCEEISERWVIFKVDDVDYALPFYHACYLQPTNPEALVEGLKPHYNNMFISLEPGCTDEVFLTFPGYSRTEMDVIFEILDKSMYVWSWGFDSASVILELDKDNRFEESIAVLIKSGVELTNL